MNGIPAAIDHLKPVNMKQDRFAWVQYLDGREVSRYEAQTAELAKSFGRCVADEVENSIKHGSKPRPGVFSCAIIEL